jgi:hypothetical protein
LTIWRDIKLQNPCRKCQWIGVSLTYDYNNDWAYVDLLNDVNDCIVISKDIVMIDNINISGIYGCRQQKKVVDNNKFFQHTHEMKNTFFNSICKNKKSKIPLIIIDNHILSYRKSIPVDMLMLNMS